MELLPVRYGRCRTLRFIFRSLLLISQVTDRCSAWVQQPSIPSSLIVQYCCDVNGVHWRCPPNQNVCLSFRRDPCPEWCDMCGQTWTEPAFSNRIRSEPFVNEKQLALDWIIRPSAHHWYYVSSPFQTGNDSSTAIASFHHHIDWRHAGFH